MTSQKVIIFGQEKNYMKRKITAKRCIWKNEVTRSYCVQLHYVMFKKLVEIMCAGLGVSMKGVGQGEVTFVSGFFSKFGAYSLIASTIYIST
jgi:hypothetical protein